LIWIRIQQLKQIQTDPCRCRSETQKELPTSYNCMRIPTCVQSRICIQCGAQVHVGVHTSPAAYTSETQQLTKTQLRHQSAEISTLVPKSWKVFIKVKKIHRNYHSWDASSGIGSRCSNFTSIWREKSLPKSFLHF